MTRDATAFGLQSNVRFPEAARARTPAEWLKAGLRELRSHLRPLRGGFRDLPGWVMQARAEQRWARRAAQRPHSLPEPLVVSLTSYPPRFPTLALSLKCLLTQSVAPDRVILWIAHDDIAALPRDVLDLRRDGLTIEGAAELGPFKKLVPARARFPDAFLVTADDDVYYPSNWLAGLTESYRAGQREILAYRVHRATQAINGGVAPYLKWAFDIPRGPPSPFNVATGVGGVLYPPGSLHKDALREDLFQRLCPRSDDLWFYVMARRAEWRVRKVGPRRPFISWPGSQREALQHHNIIEGGCNDRHFTRLIEHFGSPFEAGPPARRSPCPERRRHVRTRSMQ